MYIIIIIILMIIIIIIILIIFVNIFLFIYNYTYIYIHWFILPGWEDTSSLSVSTMASADPRTQEMFLASWSTCRNVLDK